MAIQSTEEHGHQAHDGSPNVVRMPNAPTWADQARQTVQSMMGDPKPMDTITANERTKNPATTPLLLSRAQLEALLKKSGIRKEDSARVVSLIENRQKFNTYIDGVRLDYNQIEMGGEEGLALYASVSPLEREGILASLGIDDTVVEKEEQLWVQAQAAERESRGQQSTALEEAIHPGAAPSAASEDRTRRGGKQLPVSHFSPELTHQLSSRAPRQLQTEIEL